MASQRKIESARLNGARSHGPKTPEGKAISSQNARKDLTRKTVVLKNEAHERFNAIHDEYTGEFQPQTPSEKDAVEEMVAAKWQQRRLWGLITATLDLQLVKQAKQIEHDWEQIDSMKRLAIAHQTLTDTSKTLKELRHMLRDVGRDYDRAFERLLDLRILNKTEDPSATAPDGEIENQENNVPAPEPLTPTGFEINGLIHT